jgi:hypothetical protein
VVKGHEALAEPASAAHRLAHDTLVHLVRTRNASLVAVRVALPAGWDAAAFASMLRGHYAERGYDDVGVTVLETAGEPRLLSVVTG